MKLKRSHSFRAGFSITEVLVVVAIIAVLLALAVPYIRKAQDEARDFECLSNLRRLGNAFVHYANDHDLTLPRRSIPASGSSPASNWVFLMTGFLDNGLDYIGARDGANLITLSRKAKGKKSPLLCTQNSINAGSPRNSTATTYAMNNNCSSIKLLTVRQPSKVCLLVEGLPSGGSWPISLGPGSPFVGTDVHGKHGNVLFLDGHIEAMREVPASGSEFWLPE